LDINHDGHESIFSDTGLNCFYEAELKEWAIPVLDKKPLLISEDGVKLFEGTLYWSVNNMSGEWLLSNDKKADKKEYEMATQSLVVTKPTQHKAYYLKGNALKFIEKMNKPKEIEIELHSRGGVLINKYGVVFNGTVNGLTIHQLNQINEALTQLNQS